MSRKRTSQKPSAIKDAMEADTEVVETHTETVPIDEPVEARTGQKQSTEAHSETEVRSTGTPEQIDIEEFVSTLSDSLGKLSEAIDGEEAIGMLDTLEEMLDQVDVMDVQEPEELDGEQEEPTGEKPEFTQVDKDAMKAEIAKLKTDLQALKNLVDQGKQNLDQLEKIKDDFVPDFVDYIDTLNDYANKIARTSSGGGSAFNTEDLAHVCLAFEYIMAMKDLLLAILKEIINHFGELTTYEMICVALIPIAACATLIANILNIAANVIGGAFKLTIIGAFIDTKLGTAVEKFIRIAAQILKIIGLIASICKFIIGQIDGEIGEFFSIIDRIFAYVFWAIDCITHATGVMAVEKVPKLPKPISGWDIIDPYYWIAGEVEPVIEPFIPPIVIGMTSPTPIIQGPSITPLLDDYIPNEEYEIPKMEFDAGGTTF